MTYGQFWRINAVTIAILIFIISLTPDPEKMVQAQSFTTWLARIIFGNPTAADKIAHFMAYGGLAFFSILGFVNRPAHYIRIMSILMAYGFLLEIFQAMGGIRQGDGADMLANGAGVIMGAGGAFCIRYFTRHFGINIPFPIRPKTRSSS
ncbi:MAG: VanZ family protein [Pseudomonadota bacterium]